MIICQITLVGDD